MDIFPQNTVILHMPNALNEIYAALSVKSPMPHDVFEASCAHQNAILPCSIARIKQIHSNIILRVDTENLSIEPPPQADGLFTELADTALAIRVADCAPVVFFSPKTNAICAVHAGWRGTALDICENAVQLFLKQGIDASTMRAYIGPCIHADDYEVGEEFFEIFPHSTFLRNGKAFFDLPLEIKHRLMQVGVRNVAIFPHSTFSNSWLHSHRREQENAGRNVFYIWRSCTN